MFISDPEKFQQSEKGQCCGDQLFHFPTVDAHTGKYSQKETGRR